MNTSKIAIIALLALCFAPIARAQDATRVAVANPARIFSEIQETKDLMQKMKSDQAQLKLEVEARQQKVKDLQAARDLLKADSPQFQEAEKAFMQEAIQFDTWGKITKAQYEGQQKQQMKLLFDKIVTATAEVAQAKGFDLIVADQRPELPENLSAIDVNQLRAILNGRNVLYAGNRVDVTNEVVAALDAKYKGTAGAAPAPAPAPAPVAPTPAPAPAQ